MGGHDFHEVVYTNSDVEAVYEDLCAEAVLEYGNNGYNGTISTTRGVNPVRVPPMSLAAAFTLASDRVDGLDKWNACEAIPLLEERQPVYENDGRVTVSLQVPWSVYSDHDAMRSALGKKLGRSADEVADWFLIARETTVTRRAKITATSGPRETRHFVVSSNQNQLPAWALGHRTQAAAREALKGIGANLLAETVELEVISITRRVDGQPLVKATLTAKDVNAKASVSLQRKTCDGFLGTKQAGWLFYGWAAS
ncbi:hypothetical protein [Rhodococcus sp. EPR-134]|uniref:hypothetical protein n=1 Tax=Rhodococcus sp. EPR-134 TaxID=1813675 RepID=UPI0007BB5AB0|nr:hypothetical protein [Rhodococcus sp. EPR-134]KZF17787.1 hypothetical protein A2J01_22680 [Rhodococcus sp. EPR-134]